MRQSASASAKKFSEPVAAGLPSNRSSHFADASRPSMHCCGTTAWRKRFDGGEQSSAYGGGFMKKNWLLLPILVLACAFAQADEELYRWVDAQGNVHYSDHLPPATIKQFEKMKALGGKPGDVPLPYVLQQAVNNFPVKLYTTDCGETCTRARALLAKRGIPYTELDASVAQTQQELKKLTGGTLEVPVLQVGSDTVRGFEE